MRRYSTSLGDEWDAIAARVYDDRYRGEMLVSLLIEANPEHRETLVFGAGVELVIPDAPPAKPASLPPWKR